MATVTDANERTFVLDHLLDVEAFTRLVRKRSFEFTGRLAVQDLSLVGTDKNSAAIEPAVSCVVLRDVTVFFFVDCACLQRQVLIFFHEVLICLFASN